MNFLTSIYKFLCSKKDWELYSLLLSISFAFDCLIYHIFNLDFEEAVRLSTSPFEQYFALLFFAPVFETIIFQYSIFEVSMKCCGRLNSKAGVIISYIISTTLFIVSHGIRIADILGVLMIGMSLGLMYVIQRYRKGVIVACIATAVLHLSYNGLSMLINHILCR